MESYFRKSTALKHSPHAVLHRHQVSQCSAFSLKHSSHQRALLDLRGQRALPNARKSQGGCGRARSSPAGCWIPRGSAWQWFLAAGAWDHTVTADNWAAMTTRSGAPVRRHKMRLKYLSSLQTGSQAKQHSEQPCVYPSADTPELITERNSEKTAS